MADAAVNATVRSDPGRLAPADLPRTECTAIGVGQQAVKPQRPILEVAQLRKDVGPVLEAIEHGSQQTKRLPLGLALAAEDVGYLG